MVPEVPQPTPSGAVRRTWIKRAHDAARAQALAAEAGLPPLVARLLVARGVDTAEAARRFLEPRLEHLPHPFAMRDLERAAHRLADAIVKRERVCLYGDYDVDGVTSASLLGEFLHLHGLDADIYIPKRLKEGYGLNEAAVDRIADDGAQLMVTLDCGITAAREIARANERGVECVVVDHHRCPTELPPAVALLNPHQDGCDYPEKVLAAVGVTFNLVIGIRKVLRERGFYGPDRPEPNLLRLTDLVALGTVADMVPLTGVNRVLTHFGIHVLRRAERPGLRALMEVARTRPAQLGSQDIAFRLGPRINAAGRLADATVGVRLLLSNTIEAARPLAAALDEANGNRQQIEADVYEAAVERVEALVAAEGDLPDVLVLGDPEWHPGVVGIVASKLVERYDRPTILVGEGGRGSGRTAKGLHLYDAMRDCERHLVKFGGHQAAAGLRMRFEDLDAFRSDLLARVQADEAYGGATESSLDYDDDIEPTAIDLDAYRMLRRLEPFGHSNPQPVFRVPRMKVRDARVVGRDHLKLRLEGERRLVEAIAFKKGELFDRCAPGTAVDLAACLELNEWQGYTSVQLRVLDLDPEPGPEG